MLYLPTLGYYPMGFLKYFSVPTAYQTVFLLSMFITTAGIILLLFFYRYSILLPDNHLFKLNPRKRKIAYICTFVVYTVIPSIMEYYIIPDQHEAKLIVEKHTVLGGLKLTIIGINPMNKNCLKILHRIKVWKGQGPVQNVRAIVLRSSFCDSTGVDSDINLMES
uniref:Proton_antipo_M domain-containing protein n=1 Tax=Heterorhabditis bacteriophora TaxID=37862 RepID=A0A1I7WEW3_HETBA